MYFVAYKGKKKKKGAVTRGEKILSDLSNETLLSPPFGLPPRCCPYSSPDVSVYFVSLPEERAERRKPAGQR